MKFGGYELEYTPDVCSLPKPQKSVSLVETYSSVQFFNWGMVLPGVQISLQWDLMSTEEFLALDKIYAQNGAVVWESGIQDKSYEVLIANFSGALINGSDGVFRQDITMDLYVVSEVQ